MENVGTGQRLQFLVPVPDGLPAHAAVELQLLNALQKLHHLLPDLRLLALAPVDALAEAVHLQRAQLQEQRVRKRIRTWLNLFKIIWQPLTHTSDKCCQVISAVKILINWSIILFLSWPKWLIKGPNLSYFHLYLLHYCNGLKAWYIEKRGFINSFMHSTDLNRRNLCNSYCTIFEVSPNATYNL